MLPLNGIALVTGAASGIGQECALAFAAHGAAGVVLVDLDLSSVQAIAEKSAKVAKNASYRPLPLSVDVADAEQVQDMVSQTLSMFGKIDYNVNCAGVSMTTAISLENISMEEWERVNRVNVHGILYCMQAVGKAMKSQPRITFPGRNRSRDGGKGSIVNIGSIHSFLSAPGTAQYTTSKHAMLGLTRAAALDFASMGIRVNAVCPSWVNTPMINGNEELAQVHKSLTKVVPLGRIAEPEEIADVALYLCSSMASYVTGSAWMADGGFTSSTKL
ncbi:hypothetical protein ASPWEDRAFT_160368 [Aspergillus wentii DTO 134E9]|uniref:Uncharacterized protein n=1 Tax=Aspergillus wentii DTO 134E9 TaxID=1073089 RepID=A0A1L9RF34_ASPWE|nr:uncharacterized protein ASPWEDRAFT_160368 [Aspergillus wentii DTO 134E9]KAI9926207.1 hypothetical protein MW887_004670 [Aspergillus wentii]OJJ33532.1 hypothetical protein ASPWEDRAFT_160368 [Aspergillus wentii DTO 134E9]